jgi:penicillin-binding protein 1A
MGGKTGTTNDNSDLWFVGYTPQLLAGVWVGCDDRFIRSNDGGAYQGGKAAAPIWKYFFRRVLNDKSLKIRKDTVFTKPPKVDNSATMDYQRLIDAMPEDNEEMYNEQTSTRRGGGNVDLSGEEYNNLDENGKELGGESNQYTEEGDEKPIPPSKPDSSSKKQPANTPKDAPKVVPPKKDVPKKPDVPKPANGNDYKK